MVGIIFQVIIAWAVIAVVISRQLFQKWLAVNIRFCVAVRYLVVIATQIAEVTHRPSNVAQLSPHFTSLIPPPGTAEEHNIAIGKVDIEIIAVETCPPRWTRS